MHLLRQTMHPLFPDEMTVVGKDVSGFRCSQSEYPVLIGWIPDRL